MKNFEEFQELDNKYEVFQSFENLIKYVETNNDFIELFKYLTDEEKYEVIQKDYYVRQHDSLKKQTIESIESDEIKNRLINNEELRKKVLNNRSFATLITKMQPSSIKSILNNEQLMSEYEVSGNTISICLRKLEDNDKKEILSNDTLLEKYKMKAEDISYVLCSINDDNYKEDYLKNHESLNEHKCSIIRSCSDSRKEDILLKDEYELSEMDIKHILSTFQYDNLNEFLKNNQEFLQNKEIPTFDIFKYMSKEKLLESIYNIDKYDMSQNEKKAVVALLSHNIKDELDRAKLDSKYSRLLDMEVKSYRIIPDFQRDLECYEGLDDLLYINPLEKEFKLDDIVALSKYCTNMKVSDSMDSYQSTIDEYIEGENWANSVIKQLNPEWTDIQKMAFIDNQIGKRISYSPDHDTEVANTDDERSSFKIMATGYGVCNGVAKVEKYILDKVGIKSEIIGTDNHAFLCIKNIDIPTEEGTIKGDTLLDPTWNLSNQKYNARPGHFCLSYEEMREADIEDDGTDNCAHKSKELEKISDKLISLDDANLRKVYKSIGLLRDDNKFPVTELMDNIDNIDKSSNGIKEQLTKRMEALKDYCPDFAKFTNSTIKIMHALVLRNTDNFDYERCIVSRVYDKQDEEKKPVLFTYLDFGKSGKVFYYADKEKNSMIPLTVEQFENRFECYEKDKELYNNKNMWKSSKTVNISKEKDTGDLNLDDNEKDDIVEEER